MPSIAHGVSSVFAFGVAVAIGNLVFVRRYSELDEERLHADGEKILKPLWLTEAEVSDLVAFLETLSAPPSGLMMELLPTARAREPCVAVRP